MVRVVDVDSHVYEPPAVWEDYIPPDQRSAAKNAFYAEVEAEGDQQTILNGGATKSLNRRKLIRQAIWRPGMTLDEVGHLDPDTFHPLNPGAWDPDARVADMDAMGVDEAIVFPTLFNEYLPQVLDADDAGVLARAYNDWVWDFSVATGARVHPAALLPLQSVALAAAELERVAQKGFRSVVMRPAFYKMNIGPDELFSVVTGQLAAMEGPRPVFIEDKPFRPIWDRIDALGLVVCVHPSLGITGADIVSNGAFIERVSGRMGVTHTVAEPVAQLQDNDLFMTAALFHGLFEDLPNLKVAFHHSGATWVPLALEKCETYLWLTAYGMANPVCLETEEVWERHPAIVSFDGWERAVAKMVHHFTSKAAWGSRYPFHDAAGPDEAQQMLESEGVESATIDRLLGSNAAELFSLRVVAEG